MSRWKIILFIFLGLFVIAGAGYFGFYGFQAPPGISPAAPTATPPATVPVAVGDVRQLVSAPGELIETQQMNLTIGVAGTLAEVDARPGDAVKKGQALARLGDQSKYDAAVASTYLDLLTAQQDLADLIANAPKETADAQQALIQAQDDYTKAKAVVDSQKYPRASQDRLDSASADYQSALEEVAVAQDRYDKVANRNTDDPLRVNALQALTQAQQQRDQLLGTMNWLSAKPTDKDIADAQAKMDQTKAILDNAQRKWDQVKNGPDAMALELAQAKIADMQRQYAQAQDDLSHLTLAAPFDGVITDVKASYGDQVTATTIIMTIVNPNALEAQVTVVEEDYPLIQPGLSAQLFFDAQPEVQGIGHVDRIVPSRTADAQPLYPVDITIDQLPPRLAPGMSVDSSIIIAEKKSVLVLPKALVRARTDGTATVQVWANGRKENREIKIGLIGDQNVEIVSGLQKGEQVVGQ